MVTRIEKTVYLTVWFDGGFWALHTEAGLYHHLRSPCIPLLPALVYTNGNLDDRRRLPPRRHAPQPTDACARLHIRAREPKQANELLHHHLFRQVAAVRNACYDICHGLAARSFASSYRTGRCPCLRLRHESLAGVRWRQTFPHYATGCAEGVCQTRRHAVSPTRRYGVQW